MTDAYLDTAISYVQGACDVTGNRLSEAFVGLNNQTPKGMFEPPNLPLPDGRIRPGHTIETVYVYGPVNATLKSAQVDGKPLEIFADSEFGRPVWWTPLFFSNGEKRVLSLTFEEPAVPDSTPRILAQPMATPMTITSVPGAACGGSQ